MCVGGGGYCELHVNFEDFLFIVHAILIFQVQSIVGMREREVSRFRETFEF